HVLYIAGVTHPCRLEAENLRLFVGGGSMLHAARHDATIARPHFQHMIPEFHSELSLPNQEELFFIAVRVPGKLALNFDQLDFLSVQSGNDLWPPMVVKQGEFLLQANLFHHKSFGRTKSTSL